MRKYIKTNVLKSAKIIDNAYVLLFKLIDKNDRDSIRTLLPDLQAQIIENGETLESNLGEGCSCVKILESICEDIWNISMLCDEDDSITRSKEQRKICKDMVRKMNKFVSELTAVKEEKVALFLPYKAAMWDSLCGAYIKARDDENCEAVVVPIPYFEKNTDGTTGKMFYEKDLFDKNLPLYDFDKIDYNQLHPEEIYIHNPYDECNYVTTVHPFFYSANLKNFTDKLIYIPYFIHQNDYVKKEYCELPGVVYADEVYLQSEKVREQYIRIYKENIPDAKDIDKFKVVTSSKLAMYNTADEDIPEEWKKHIFCDDKKRKIIFFNTHLSCCMKQYSDDFFVKIREIFRLFNDNPDVVLLWRPHPLTISTIRSMNPSVEEKYLELINEYKEKSIGIFDDSPDVHRAVNISDAYYGSRSSVVEMFKIQEKPIMIMNLRIHG